MKAATMQCGRRLERGWMNAMTASAALVMLSAAASALAQNPLPDSPGGPDDPISVVVGTDASGEEITDGEADFSEVFTVCKDVAVEDQRVQQGQRVRGHLDPLLEDARRIGGLAVSVHGGVHLGQFLLGEPVVLPLGGGQVPPVHDQVHPVEVHEHLADRRVAEGRLQGP